MLLQQPSHLLLRAHPAFLLLRRLVLCFPARRTTHTHKTTKTIHEIVVL